MLLQKIRLSTVPLREDPRLLLSFVPFQFTIPSMAVDAVVARLRWMHEKGLVNDVCEFAPG